MAEIGSAFLSILPSAKGFGRKLESDVSRETSSSGKKIGAGFGKAFAAAGGLVIAAGVGSFLKDAIGGAGDLEQSVGAIDTVFGRSAKQMQSWSKGAALSVGLTRNEFNELGTLIGSQLKNGGTAMDELAPKTNNLIKLGADLSSMFGGTTKDAVGALSSALKGERDPIEAYGVSLNQAKIDAEAAALGFEKVGGALSQEAQQAATLSLIMKQTKDAHGNFAKESGTYAGQVQRLGAQWGNLKTTIGTALLPVLTRLVTGFNRLFQSFQSGRGAAGQLTAAAQRLGPVLRQVGDFIRSRVVPAAQALFQWYVQKIVPGIKSALVPVLNGARNAFQRITASVRANEPQLRQLLNGFKSFAEFLYNRILPLVGKLLGTAFRNMGKQVSATIAIIGGIVRGFNSAREAAQRMGAVIKSIPSIIKGAFSGASTMLYSVGVDLIQGLINGVKNMAGSVASAAKDVVQGAVNAAKSALQIRSPSRVFRRIGEDTMRGMERGIQRRGPQVLKAMKAELDKLVARSKSLTDAFASMRSSIAQTFAGDLFGQDTAAKFLLNLTQTRNNLKGLSAAFKKLRGWGLSPQFLSSLFQSGNTGLILDLAAGAKAQATSAQAMYGQVNALASGLGSSVAGAVYNPQINETNVEIRALRKDVQVLAKQIGREVNGAGAKGKRGQRK